MQGFLYEKRFSSPVALMQPFFNRTPKITNISQNSSILINLSIFSCVYELIYLDIIHLHMTEISHIQMNNDSKCNQKAYLAFEAS